MAITRTVLKNMNEAVQNSDKQTLNYLLASHQARISTSRPCYHYRFPLLLREHPSQSFPPVPQCPARTVPSVPVC